MLSHVGAAAGGYTSTGGYTASGVTSVPSSSAPAFASQPGACHAGITLLLVARSCDPPLCSTAIAQVQSLQQRAGVVRQHPQTLPSPHQLQPHHPRASKLAHDTRACSDRPCPVSTNPEASCWPCAGNGQYSHNGGYGGRYGYWYGGGYGASSTTPTGLVGIGALPLQMGHVPKGVLLQCMGSCSLVTSLSTAGSVVACCSLQRPPHHTACSALLGLAAEHVCCCRGPVPLPACLLGVQLRH